MYCCNKRKLSITDETISVFSLNNYEGYAKVTDVYDGDTFKACIVLHNRILKFNFRTIGYDSPEIKPPKGENPEKGLPRKHIAPKRHLLEKENQEKGKHRKGIAPKIDFPEKQNYLS